MTTEQTLMQRSDSRCELCSSNQQLSVYAVPPDSSQHVDNCVLLCHHCLEQLQADAALDTHHWRCLNDSMWSQVAAVQVLAWRQLNRLSEENWAQDLLAMLYLDEELLRWAKATDTPQSESSEATLDSNGTALAAGDTVTLIKDLVVKGANFTAKRGTAVRNISLTSDPSQIEGRVNGTRIVLLSCYLKKSS
jgi:protein PhnA